MLTTTLSPRSPSATSVAPKVAFAIRIGLVTAALAATAALPTDRSFPNLAVTFAVLALFPTLFELQARAAAVPRGSRVVVLAAGIGVAVSFRFPPGITAAMLVAPWSILLALRAWEALVTVIRNRHRSLSDVTVAAGVVLPVVGGGWLVMSRLGFRPLSFADEIVILTAVHFHYAGGVLPTLLGLSARRQPGRIANLACAGCLAGMPLVAIGITSTHLRGPAVLEIAAAMTMAVSGLLAAGLFASQAVARGSSTIRGLLLAAGFAPAALLAERLTRETVTAA
jgi:hypothetical protein